MRTYDLTPIDARKSFYGKAKVTVDDNGTETLYSYDTPIISRNKNGELKPLYTGDKYGATTTRHVIAFCGVNKAEYRKLLKANGMKFVQE